MWAAIFCSCVAFLAVFTVKRHKTSPLLPPGPSRLPIIGNLLDIPKKHQWIQYLEWSKVYNSDILHLSVFGTSLIILNSLKATEDLLVRRSTLYSSRPPNVMLIDLMGWSFGISVLPYGEAWRIRRRAFWQELNPTKAPIYHPCQQKHARGLLKRLLDSPDNFFHHIRYTFGSSIIEITYGIKVQPRDDPYITLTNKVLHEFDEAVITGSFLIDWFPFLRLVPSWFPGAGFKVFAESAKKNTLGMIQGPFDVAKELLTKEPEDHCFVGRSLIRSKSTTEENFEDEIIRDAAGIAHAGGADTSPSALTTFIAAMMLFPEVQAKAQQEIDAQVGNNRLPIFADQEFTPYLTAIALEVLRWRPVSPLGIRCVTADDEYRGYHISKGSVIVINQWAILRDESMFPEPDEFRPERFLKDGKINTDLSEPLAAFGFGRRICPGRYIAKDSLWITIASVLSVYNIRKPTDEDGHEIEQPIEHTSGLIRQPLPFKCSIKPRSVEAEKLIRGG